MYLRQLRRDQCPRVNLKLEREDMETPRSERSSQVRRRFPVCIGTEVDGPQ